MPWCKNSICVNSSTLFNTTTSLSVNTITYNIIWMQTTSFPFVPNAECSCVNGPQGESLKLPYLRKKTCSSCFPHFPPQTELWNQESRDYGGKVYADLKRQKLGLTIEHKDSIDKGDEWKLFCCCLLGSALNSQVFYVD